MVREHGWAAYESQHKILQHVAFRKVMIRSSSDFRLGCSGMVPNPRLPNHMLIHTSH